MRYTCSRRQLNQEFSCRSSKQYLTNSGEEGAYGDDDDDGVLLEEYLLDGLAVYAHDRFGEGKNDVLACPAKGI